MGLFDSFFGKVLYFPGCAPKFLDKDVMQRHKQLLNLFGISFVTLPELEVCCGKPALDYGFLEDFKDLKRKNSAVFEAHKIKKIITGTPEAYYIFKKKYDDIPVEYIGQTILDNVDKLEKKYEGQAVTYFDPCNPYKLPELYSIPREILTAVGLKVVNLSACKQKSMCCGKALEHISPKVGDEMGRAILGEVKTKTLITTSTSCYLQLKGLSKSVRVRELSEVLL
jgi:heterodisulfide reductase subunit D